MKNTFSLASTLGLPTPRMRKANKFCMVSAAHPLVKRHSYRLFRFISFRCVTRGEVLIGRPALPDDRRYPRGGRPSRGENPDPDPENAAPENAIFWKRVSWWKTQRTQPSRFRVDSESAYFLKRWRHRPTPRPLVSDLWIPQRLITTTTTTTTMMDYMLVFMLAIFIFSLLCSVSPSTICLFTERKLSMRALSLLHSVFVNVKRHL